jgi:hypothetical protein
VVAFRNAADAFTITSNALSTLYEHHDDSNDHETPRGDGDERRGLSKSSTWR